MTVRLLMALVVLFVQDAPVDVTGKWSFQVETQLGTGTPSVVFNQMGEKLTGHYSGQLGDVDFTGSVKGKEITFTFSTNVQGTDLKVTYTGTIQSKDSLKGIVSFAGLGDGTFTAKRN
jgi:hypothetical protein